MILMSLSFSLSLTPSPFQCLHWKEKEWIPFYRRCSAKIRAELSINQNLDPDSPFPSDLDPNLRPASWPRIFPCLNIDLLFLLYDFYHYISFFPSNVCLHLRGKMGLPLIANTACFFVVLAKRPLSAQNQVSNHSRWHLSTSLYSLIYLFIYLSI